MRIPFFVVALAVMVATSIPRVQANTFPTNGDEYEYQFDEDYEYGDYSVDDEASGTQDTAIEVVPKFITEGAAFTVDAGTTLRLPCVVDKLPKNFVLMWKKKGVKGANILAVDTQETGSNVKVEVKHEGSNQGSTLVIPLAKQDDAGEYICEMATQSHLKIKHTVSVRAPPKISKSPNNGFVQATKGDSIKLSCKGEGDPMPRIIWTRKGGKMPDGNDFIEGTELTFTNVNRHYAGIYKCTADNGFGTPAVEEIEVDVRYPPEVEVEEVYIHAAAGNKVELVCKVHARPHASVFWYKNDNIALTNESADLSVVNHRHILTLEDVREEDFGNYTCRAKNSLGEDHGNLEISGLADYPKFLSRPGGMDPDKYQIEWTALSHTPIQKFALKYRDSQSNDWTHIDVTPQPENKDNNYVGKLILTDLSEATRYEAKVSSLNKHGWSRPSEVFHFATFGVDPITDAIGSNANILSLPTLVTLLLWSILVVLPMF